MASSGTAETLRVVVRVRGPRLDDGWLRIRGDSAESPLPAIVLDDGLGPATFECHSACGPEATQADVYEAARLNTIVENALIGISSTCMAFGRTASGKTYTMQGEVASMQGEVASMQEEIGKLKIKLSGQEEATTKANEQTRSEASEKAHWMRKCEGAEATATRASAQVEQLTADQFAFVAPEWH